MEAQWLSDDARAMLAKLPGPAPVPYDAARLERAHGIVDALLGTGSAGAPKDPLAGVIADVNAARGKVVAADVPSGVDASTGEVAGEAVRAVATAAFHAAKPGLWIAPGKTHAGAVAVIDIGIPSGAPGDADVARVNAGVLRDMPRRGTDSTKFTSGNVVVIGGSRGLTGAPTMAALAAARSGAGYVTVAGPASLELAFATRLLEAMFTGLPEEDGRLCPRASRTRWRPSAGRTPSSSGRASGGRRARRRSSARSSTASTSPSCWTRTGSTRSPGGSRTSATAAGRRCSPRTPASSAGCSRSTRAEAARRLHHAREAAARARAIVVLKGDDTLVAAPGGRVAVSPGGAPALATAGTGDVLSGVIGAMLAKGMRRRTRPAPGSTRTCARGSSRPRRMARTASSRRTSSPRCPRRSPRRIPGRPCRSPSPTSWIPTR